jgi:5-methylthioribose kinase
MANLVLCEIPEDPIYYEALYDMERKKNADLERQLVEAQSTIEALTVEIRTMRYAQNPNTLERMIQHGEVPVGEFLISQKFSCVSMKQETQIALAIG